MSYQQYENSTHDGAPFEMYTFRYGNTTLHYTSSDDKSFTVETAKVISLPIERSAVTNTTDSIKSNMTITLPSNDEFARKLVTIGLEYPVSVRINRVHRNDAQYENVTIWRGRVVGAALANERIELQCESIFTSVQRQGLSQQYNLSCRHALYGRQCRVNRAEFSKELRITGFDSVSVSHEGMDGWHYNPVGGYVVINGEIKRSIVGATNTLIHFDPPYKDDTIRSATIYAGCDKTIETCQRHFHNTDNFGGFPYIPIKNPFEGAL